MNLNGRIGTLERRLGVDDGCPACGQGGGRRVDVRLVEHGDDPGPTNCPACGRPLIFTLRLGETRLDDEEAGGA